MLFLQIGEEWGDVDDKCGGETFMCINGDVEPKRTELKCPFANQECKLLNGRKQCFCEAGYSITAEGTCHKGETTSILSIANLDIEYVRFYLNVYPIFCKCKGYEMSWCLCEISGFL